MFGPEGPKGAFMAIDYKLREKSNIWISYAILPLEYTPSSSYSTRCKF